MAKRKKVPQEPTTKLEAYHLWQDESDAIFSEMEDARHRYFNEHLVVPPQEVEDAIYQAGWEKQEEATRRLDERIARFDKLAKPNSKTQWRWARKNYDKQKRYDDLMRMLLDPASSETEKAVARKHLERLRAQGYGRTERRVYDEPPRQSPPPPPPPPPRQSPPPRPRAPRATAPRYPSMGEDVTHSAVVAAAAFAATAIGWRVLSLLGPQSEATQRIASEKQAKWEARRQAMRRPR